MKKIAFLSIIVFNVSLISCEKDNKCKLVVVKDCTGTYLRIDSKDFKVCNEGEFVSLETGTYVRADFNVVEACSKPNSETPICYMLHETEGAIEVFNLEVE